jgi:hypothetical protein
LQEMNNNQEKHFQELKDWLNVLNSKNK